MNMYNSKNVSVTVSLPNQGIEKKVSKSERIYSTFKQGYLKNVRVRIDGSDGVHTLTNCNELIPRFGVEVGLSLLNGFIKSGKDVYTRHLRRGLKIEIFEF